MVSFQNFVTIRRAMWSKENILGCLSNRNKGMVSCCISMLGLQCQHSLNVLLYFRTCSSVPTMNRTPVRHTICNTSFSFTNHLPKQSSLAISAPIKVFRLDSGRFKNLSDTKRSTFNSGEEQYCSGADTASKAAFRL